MAKDNGAILLKSYYSRPEAEEIMRAVVPLYKIDNPKRCIYFQSGLNDIYKIETDTESFYLRLYRQGWRSKTEINFEVEALKYLRGRGVPVIMPVATHGGEYVTTIDVAEGSRHLIITDCAVGDIPDLSNYKNSMAYGRVLARLHTMSAGFECKDERFSYDLKYLVDEPLKRLKPHFFKYPDKWAQLTNQVYALADKLLPSSANPIDFGFIHGDAHFGNVHQHNDDMTLFDFDLCGYGPRAFDLAVFKRFSILQGKLKEWWLPFIDGYREVRSVCELDFALIETCASLRYFWEASMMANTIFEVQHWNLTESKLSKLIQKTAL